MRELNRTVRVRRAARVRRQRPAAARGRPRRPRPGALRASHAGRGVSRREPPDVAAPIRHAGSEQPRDARDRDRDPIGPVVELVAQLVDRLLELEHREQPFERPGSPAGSSGGRPPPGSRRGSPRAGAARSRRARRPRAAAGRPSRRRRTSAACRRRRGAAIASGAARKRSRWLALEVDDDPALAVPEHLPEVVVAVVRIVRPADPMCESRRSSLAHLLATAEDRLQLLDTSGRRRKGPLDLLVDRRREQAERLDARLVGREGRVGRVGGEHPVHARR